MKLKQSRIREQARGKCQAPKAPKKRIARFVVETDYYTRERKRYENDRRQRTSRGTSGIRFVQDRHGK